MKIEKVYVGYVKNGNLSLLRIYFNNNNLSDISSSVNIKKTQLPTFDERNENLSTKRLSFSINSNENSVSDDKDKKDNNNSLYYLTLINSLYEKIKEDVDIPILQDISELRMDKKTPNYIIYYGNQDQNEDNNSGTMTHIISIFPFKSNFVFKNKKFLMLLNKTEAATKSPSFTKVPYEDVFQLPFDKNDNIANYFYRINSDDSSNDSEETDNNIKLNVYDPLEFDSVFGTKKIRENLVERTIKKFTTKKENNEMELALTKDELSVFFGEISNDDEFKNNIVSVENKIFKNNFLIDSMATFTGSKKSTIQKIDKDKLRDVLKKLVKHTKENADCLFDIKNVPIMNGDDNIIVTSDSVPIFCSLLKNNIAEKLLNNDFYIPYYNE